MVPPKKIYTSAHGSYPYNLQHHPDKRDISTSKSFSPSGSVTPDGDYEIIRINEAYKVLSDEQLRKEYERKLDGGGVTQSEYRMILFLL